MPYMYVIQLKEALLVLFSQSLMWHVFWIPARHRRIESAVIIPVGHQRFSLHLVCAVEYTCSLSLNTALTFYPDESSPPEIS